MITSSFIHLFVLLISLQAFSQNMKASELFWKRKEIQKSMVEDRKIVVSATREESSWSFKGAARVQVPVEFCFQEAMNFDRLKKIPERFSKVEFDSKALRLKLEVVFLGSSKEMTVQLSPDKNAQKIGFKVVNGWLLGLQGDISFEGWPRQPSEVSVIASLQRSPSWIPDFVFSTVIEAVMHHVSLSLRNDLEKDYKN